MKSALVFWLLALAAFACGAAEPRPAHFCERSGERSVQEKIVCENVDIQNLDRTLGDFYRSALFFSGSKDHLREQQRRWLREIRTKCTDADCLRKVYRHRILELDNHIRATNVPGGQAVNGKNAEAVCKEVLHLADRKALANYVIPALPLEILESGNTETVRAGGRSLTETIRKINSASFGEMGEAVVRLRLSPGIDAAVFASANTGGTCASSELQNISLSASGKKRGEAEFRTMIDVNDPDEQLRWSWWGAGDYPVFVRGRHLVITALTYDPNLVTLVSWLRPDGRRVPLCSAQFETTKTISRAFEPDVCQKILNRTAESPKWESADINIPRDEWEKRFDGYADSVRVTKVDLDGSGKKLDVALFSYDSGAGCGSHKEWLRVTNSKRDGMVSGRLNDMLTKHGDGGEVSLWRVSGKYYVDSYHPYYGGAAYRITRSGPKAACHFSWESTTRIKQLWTASTPSPGEAK